MQTYNGWMAERLNGWTSENLTKLKLFPFNRWYNCIKLYEISTSHAKSHWIKFYESFTAKRKIIGEKRAHSTIPSPSLSYEKPVRIHWTREPFTILWMEEPFWERQKHMILSAAITGAIAILLQKRKIQCSHAYYNSMDKVQLNQRAFFVVCLA